MKSPKQTTPARSVTGYEVRVQISEKGAVSLYGLQRFPVTLYADQWLAIIEKAGSLKGFIDANAAKLSTKVAATSAKGTAL